MKEQMQQKATLSFFISSAVMSKESTKQVIGDLGQCKYQKVKATFTSLYLLFKPKKTLRPSSMIERRC